MKIYITGMGAISSIGKSVEENFQNLLRGENNSIIVDEWKNYDGLLSHIGAFAPDFDLKSIPRSKRRTMSKMSEMTAYAGLEALAQAKLTPDEVNHSNAAINIGSSSGSVLAMNEFYGNIFLKKSAHVQKATSVFKSMSHTASINLASALDFHGAVLSTNSACASGAHSLILMWELMTAGFYDIAIVGGCDEAHLTTSLCFDLAGAATRNFNHNPKIASRPFDRDRDGLVTSEGAGVLVLETETSVNKRGITPLAEVLGGAYICDSTHMSQPQKNAMVATMKKAVSRSRIDQNKIGYVNAHATSTIMGDQFEAEAIYDFFKKDIPVSSLKGHMGHSFGASGALEAIMCVEMLNKNILIGTSNLENIDPKLPQLNFLKENISSNNQYLLSNNFALGGINTSLIISKI